MCFYYLFHVISAGSNVRERDTSVRRKKNVTRLEHDMNATDKQDECQKNDTKMTRLP